MKMRNKMGLRTLHWGYSSLDRERRKKGSMESHMLAVRVEEVLSKNGVGLGFKRQTIWRAMQDARPY